MGFIFLTRGLWALLALPSASEVSVHKMVKGSVVLGQLTDMCWLILRGQAVWPGWKQWMTPLGSCRFCRGLTLYSAGTVSSDEQRWGAQGGKGAGALQETHGRCSTTNDALISWDPTALGPVVLCVKRVLSQPKSSDNPPPVMVRASTSSLRIGRGAVTDLWRSLGQAHCQPVPFPSPEVASSLWGALSGASFIPTPLKGKLITCPAEN